MIQSWGHTEKEHCKNPTEGNERSEKIGLNITFKKTECMIFREKKKRKKRNNADQRANYKKETPMSSKSITI